MCDIVEGLRSIGFVRRQREGCADDGDAAPPPLSDEIPSCAEGGHARVGDGPALYGRGESGQPLYALWDWEAYRRRVRCLAGKSAALGVCVGLCLAFPLACLVVAAVARRRPRAVARV